MLGHLQRGGSPTTYDRLLALRFGGAAVRAIADRAFGTMVGLNGPDIRWVPLAEVRGRSRTCRSMATSSPRRASWGSAWETDPRCRPTPYRAPRMQSRSSTGRPFPIPTAGWRTGAPTPGSGPTRRTRSAIVPAGRRPRAGADPHAPRPAARHRCARRAQPARGRYFYQRRDGRQNQPCCTGQGIRGEDRAVVDPNALDAGGTVALDWYYPSDDGRLLAYGLSENGGSEQSVLQVMDVDTGVLIPSGSCTPVPPTSPGCPTPPASTTLAIRRRARRPRARSTTTAPSIGIAWARTPRKILLIFKPAEKEHWPSVRISPDGRWLRVGVAWTFDQTDLYVMDRWSGACRSRWRRTCPPPSMARWPTAASSCAPTSTRRPTGSTWWIPSVRNASAGGRSCRRGRRRCSKACTSQVATWRSTTWSERLPGSDSPTTRAATLAS